MAATESDIIRDEQEEGNLLKAISDVETAIMNAAPTMRRILENTRDNAMKRVAVLEKKIAEAKIEAQTAEQARITAAAALAAKETKLNEQERQTYRGFLEESYFTKRDFGKLDEFYKHSYDRLSEGGKDEMSKRIHEGIRRGEFKESDLPNAVLQRELGHRAAKAKDNTLIQDKSSKRDNADNPQGTDAKVSTTKSIDLGSISLSNVKLTDANSAPNASSIPDASGAKAAQRSV